MAGVGTGFEGTLQARLRNHAGDEIAQRHFKAGGTGIWGNFFFRIDVPGVPARPRGTLEVFEISAEDGSEINKRVIPIVFGRALVDPFHGLRDPHGASRATRSRRSPTRSTATRRSSGSSSPPTATSSTTPT